MLLVRLDPHQPPVLGGILIPFREATEMLDKVEQIARDMASTRRVSEALEIAVKGLDEAIPGSRARLMLDSPGFHLGSDHIFEPYRDLLADYDEEIRVQAHRHGRALQSRDRSKADQPFYLAIPVEGGIFYLESAREYTSEEVSVASLVSHQFSSILLNIARIQANGRSDSLTGLPDALWFRNQVHASRFSEFAIVAVEIDGFTEFNHREGRAAGDQLLRFVVDFLSGQLQRGDVLARSQSDEFLLLVEAADKKRFTEEWRRNLKEFERLSARLGHQITLSIGAAFYPEDVTSRDQLIELAELACLRATAISNQLVLVASAPLPQLGPGEGLAKTRPDDHFDLRAQGVVRKAITHAQSCGRAGDGLALLLGVHETDFKLSRLLTANGFGSARIREWLVPGTEERVSFSPHVVAIFEQAHHYSKLQNRESVGTGALLLATLLHPSIEDAVRERGLRTGAVISGLFEGGYLTGAETLLVAPVEIRKVVCLPESHDEGELRAGAQEHLSEFLDEEVWVALAAARDEAGRMRSHVHLVHLYLGVLKVQKLPLDQARRVVHGMAFEWVKPELASIDRSVVEFLNSLGEQGAVTVGKLMRELEEEPTVARLIDTLVDLNERGDRD